MTNKPTQSPTTIPANNSTTQLPRHHHEHEQHHTNTTTQSDPESTDDESQHTDSKQKRKKRYQQQRLIPDTGQQNPLTIGTDCIIENLPWGDTAGSKHGKACRIMSHNINGIKNTGDANTFSIDCQLIARSGADIIGLQETNQNWQYCDTKSKATQQIKQSWKISTTNTSSPTEPLPQRYLPGGTMMITTGDWVGRARKRSDPSDMGRWTEVTLNGREGTKITIITAYRVCNDKIRTAGATTAFSQQWHILRRMGKTQPDPRQQILDDLKARIKELIADHHGIIVGMDANQSLNNVPNPLSRWVQECNLCDIHAHLHGSDDEPSTYNRGTERIDFQFISPDLINYITGAGALPFREVSNSDHRALFLDINLEDYLRGKPNSIAPPNTRGLCSNNLQSVKLYGDAVRDFLDSGELNDRLQHIKTEAESGWTIKLDNLADDLDQHWTSNKLDFAKAAQKPDIPWSPKLIQARKDVYYWELWLSELRTKRDFMQQRQELKPTPTSWRPASIAAAQKSLRKAQKNLRNTVKHALDHREEHLLERLHLAEDDDRKRAKSAIAKIQHAEANRKTFNRLKTALGKNITGSLDSLLVPTDPASDPATTYEWTQILDQVEINQRILERNKEHFNQAKGTPFTVPPLSELVGTDGTTAFCEEVLNGTANLDKLDVTEATKSVLRQLRRVNPKNSIDSHITCEDVKRAYKVWSETTSTSPSGLHLGHEKALLKYDSLYPPVDGEQPLSDRAFEFKAQMLNLSVTHGFVPTRWKTVVNAMLEKIPGTPKIHRLRTIHLIESDFNMLIGILWGRRIPAYGEKLNQFCEDQSGTRKDRKAQDVLFFKHLTYSLIRLTRTDAASFDNDAKSCFDRVIMNLVSLASQRLGMDPKACKLFTDVLKMAQHHVKTQLGTSDDHYTTTDTHSVHGPLQGGRGGPCSWLLVCCLLMICMHEKSDGIKFTDPFCERIVKQIMTGFVDDTTHWTNLFDQSINGENNIDQLIEATRQTAQWWEELLHTSGGRLELPKCFFYLITWSFNKEGVPRVQHRQTDIPLRDSCSGETVNINQYKCTKDHKTLGAMEAPITKYKAEKQRLLKKAKALARQVATAHLTRGDARTLFRQIYRPSIGYSLAIGVLTLPETIKIQAAPLQAILPQMGYCSKTPKAVVHGPHHLGGIGLEHLFADQGHAKSKLLLQQLRTPRPTGTLATIQLQWAQRVSGRGTAILSDPSMELPQLSEELWTVTLRQFLQESNIGIDIPKIQLPHPLRTNDTVLMDHPALTRFTPAETRQINRCRIYLQVETISELSNAVGTHLTAAARDCKRSTNHAAHGLWPRQPRPGTNHRTTWKAFLDHIAQPDNRLRTTLGAWQTIRQASWTAYYQPHEQTIYVKEGTGWAPYECTRAHRNTLVGTRTTLPPATLDEFMPDATPADLISQQGNTVKIAHSNRIESIAQKITPATTFVQYIKQQPAWVRLLLKDITELNPGLWEHLLQSRKIYIVSDGGCKPDLGGYGWVIASKSRVFWEGTGIARGSPTTPHRAEAYGKLAAIRFLIALTTYLDIHSTSPSITLCDNLQLSRIMASETAEDSAWVAVQPDHDVVKTLYDSYHELRAQLPNIDRGQHIKGHQDRTTPEDQLSWPAKLNIHAHKITTAAIQQYKGETPATDHPLPGYIAAITIDDIPQHSDYENILRWRWSEFQLQAYYEHRLNLKRSDLHRINWPSYSSARRSVSKTLSNFPTKLLINWLPTGHQTAKYGKIVTECHHCGANETVDHIMHCPARSEWRSEFIQALNKKLTDINTHPKINQDICLGVEQWLCPPDERQITRHPQTEAFHRQTHIGWNLWIRGLHSCDWIELQQQHETTKSKDPDSTKWDKEIITWCLYEIHALWTVRNAENFEETDTPSKREQEAIQAVERLYLRADELAHYDRALIDEPLEDKLKKHWHTAAPSRAVDWAFGPE